MRRLAALLLVFFVLTVECLEGRSGTRGGATSSAAAVAGTRRLRFGNKSGEFKILQVADMHYADGKETGCLDVFTEQLPFCSDLNTTAFIYRVIRAENPDFIVFTGDNIFGLDSKDAAKSLNAAFEPAVKLQLPWAAVIGNHDQEGSLSREAVMRHIVGMNHTLSQLNPTGIDIDGFGNYNLEVGGAEGSALANNSVLNLYFLDSGDYSTVPSIPGYGWIKPSQQVWFQKTSSRLQQKHPAPGLAYFHIPLPEFSNFDKTNFTGVKQEGISSASINSGFFATMVEAGDVKAVFTGHDHLNDFCGKLMGIELCYAGGFGYHAYGKAGWSRRARVVSASLEKSLSGREWGGVKSIKTWKRLDDEQLSRIDIEVLWIKGSTAAACSKRNLNPIPSSTGGRRTVEAAMDDHQELEHEVYGGEIPDVGDMEGDEEMLTADGDGIAEIDPNSKESLEDMKKRLKEIEEEASALRDMQARVEKEMGANQDDSPNAAATQVEKEEVDSRSIYVGNVDYSCTPEEVQQHFQSCGTVNRVTILTDKFGQPKGFAYVEFVEIEAVQNALLLNESELHGRQLKVSAKRTNIPGMKQYRGRRPNPYMAIRPRRPFMPSPYYAPYGYGKAPRFRRPMRYRPYF